MYMNSGDIYVVNRLPSQTGHPHVLVTGWEQGAAGHDCLRHLTEPLWGRASATRCVNRLVYRCVDVDVSVVMLPGRYIQSRGFLGPGSSVRLR